MKSLIFCLLGFFTALQVDAQTNIGGRVYNELGNYNKHRGLAIDSNLNLPLVSAKFGARQGAIRYNPVDSSVYVYTNYQWIKIGSGGVGGSVDTVSLSNRIDNAFSSINLLPDSTGIVFIKPNGAADTLLFSNASDPGGDGNVFNDLELLPDSSGLIFFRSNGNVDTVRFEVDGYGTPTDYSFISTSTDITLNESHSIVKITSSGTTIYLPSATVGSPGKPYTIKLSVSGTATIAATSGQFIDGASTYVLTSQNKYVTVVRDGSNWMITANN